MESEDYGGCSNRRVVNDSLGVPVVPATISQVAKNWKLWKPVAKIPDAWCMVALFIRLPSSRSQM